MAAGELPRGVKAIGVHAAKVLRKQEDISPSVTRVNACSDLRKQVAKFD